MFSNFYYNLIWILGIIHHFISVFGDHTFFAGFQKANYFWIWFKKSSKYSLRTTLNLEFRQNYIWIEIISNKYDVFNISMYVHSSSIERIFLIIFDWMYTYFQDFWSNSKKSVSFFFMFLKVMIWSLLVSFFYVSKGDDMKSSFIGSAISCSNVVSLI